MRPIDADKFEEFIRQNCADSLVDLWCELVRRQPTIEAVPVGEWIRNENPIEISCECSICHAKDYWYDIDKANEYYWFHRKFCPNCGARMKGGCE